MRVEKLIVLPNGWMSQNTACRDILTELDVFLQ